MDSVMVILHAMSLSWEGWRGEEGAWGAELPCMAAELRDLAPRLRDHVCACRRVRAAGIRGWLGV